MLLHRLKKKQKKENTAKLYLIVRLYNSLRIFQYEKKLLLFVQTCITPKKTRLIYKRWGEIWNFWSWQKHKMLSLQGSDQFSHNFLSKFCERGSVYQQKIQHPPLHILHCSLNICVVFNLFDFRFCKIKTIFLKSLRVA